jgi:hypothetical protein
MNIDVINLKEDYVGKHGFGVITPMEEYAENHRFRFSHSKGGPC